jgi:hypothetical protein
MHQKNHRLSVQDSKNNLIVIKAVIIQYLNICIFFYFIQRMHSGSVKEFEIRKQSMKRHRGNESVQVGCSVKLVEQSTVDQTLFSRTRPISTAAVEENVINYVIEEMLPLTTVEAPSFQRLVAPMMSSSLISRRTLGRRIDDKFNIMEADLKAQLSVTKFKCLTADIWSTSHRAYLGVTGHWIADDYSRKSAALSCRRMTGSHDYLAIASKLNKIIKHYDLSVDDVTSIVTDNASNFGKAFREFSKPLNADEDSDEEESNEVEVDVEFLSIDLHPPTVEQLPPSALESVNDDINDNETGDAVEVENIILPRQERCAAHTLNLVASVDGVQLTSCVKDSSVTAYTRMYNSAFGKAQALWNKYSRSTLAADAAKSACGRAIVVPGDTRWNSKWDATNVLLRIQDNGKLLAVCQSMEIPAFRPAEIEFLRDWFAINRPLAVALDSLQGDKFSYYGMLLPKLSVLMFELKRHLATVSSVMIPLVSSLIGGVERRFPTLNLEDPGSRTAVLAAISNPLYKLRWMSPQTRLEMESWFIEQVRRLPLDSGVTGILSSNEAPATQTQPSPVDEFHMFNNDGIGHTGGALHCDIEAINYLADASTQLSMLNSYPRIKQLFFKTNTSLPSSAAVERLFSAGGLIHVPRRNKLSDNTFEKLLLLKANKSD